jgi:hypothetical protein
VTNTILTHNLHNHVILVHSFYTVTQRRRYIPIYFTNSHFLHAQNSNKEIFNSQVLYQSLPETAADTISKASRQAKLHVIILAAVPQEQFSHYCT